MKNHSECEIPESKKEILVLDKRCAKRGAVSFDSQIKNYKNMSQSFPQSQSHQSKDSKDQLFKLRDRLVDFILFWILLGSFLLASWLDSLDQIP